LPAILRLNTFDIDSKNQVIYNTADKTAIKSSEFTTKDGIIMNKNTIRIRTMTIAALLSAIGIIIPLYSPIKIVIEPASFTFASHVPIFIAMFISPAAAVFTSIVTAFGFFINYTPIIGFRALSHVVFALTGAYILKMRNNILLSLKKSIPFVLVLSLIHAVCELIVSTIFYFSDQTSVNYVYNVVLLVGAGTFIHSSIDFIMAAAIWAPVQKVINVPTNAKIRYRSSKIH